MTYDFDPVKYGVLWQKVEGYEEKFKELSKTQDKMEKQLEELLALANKGRGGFWVGMMVVSGISSIVGFLAHYFSSK
jgi:hypothetical protein